ncbi:MAG: OmpA family protein [Alphaproteobacteria bacterium]|nr:OmpA family protein [Alphaproteobacteria bacterium]
MERTKKSWVVGFAVVATTVFISGCAENTISELERAPLDGLAFADQLAKEYELYAKRESREYNDFIDAQHFAVKGLQASTGLNVLPENPNDWDIPESELPRFLDARERLTFALDNNGRNVAPDIAARTQVSYDCAVQEQEENAGRPEQARCWTGFMNGLRHLEEAIQKQSPTFSVMFEMNSSVLSKDAESKLSNVAKAAKNMNLRTVLVTGHADAMGGRKHNLLLSQNRANAVRDALVKMGVEAKRIVAVGAGEADGREVVPKNRRVDIQLH